MAHSRFHQSVHSEKIFHAENSVDGKADLRKAVDFDQAQHMLAAAGAKPKECINPLCPSPSPQDLNYFRRLASRDHRDRRGWGKGGAGGKSKTGGDFNLF